MLNNKTILITGATGSFGQKFVSKILNKYKSIKKVIVFSRDEYKQLLMQEKFEKNNYKKLRFFLGDIRDVNRLKQAFEGVDIIVHAAALKQVPAAEYNPIEFIKTNIIGAQNIIEAAIEKNVSKVLSLSTDKAVAPINLYGATKLCADKLFLAANNIKGGKKITFSILRYGNVMMSRGSVIPIFLKIKNNIFPVTDKKMTRFSITLDQSVEIAIKALEYSMGGEIFIPKLKSYKIVDLVKAISGSGKIKNIGIRQGEKIHEELISKGETADIFSYKDFYIISSQTKKNLKGDYKMIEKNFSYNSNNSGFYNINELKKIIRGELK
ncbi:UDP-N-acetylglucosamine 4,6-dehydratase (inverting) [Candidatus Pelagibacter sp.]|nr:UDP-N-acetylglucosamine 4,6-dehydratase (inverting) [Candidatus Pelagibacter sp.]